MSTTTLQDATRNLLQANTARLVSFEQAVRDEHERTSKPHPVLHAIERVSPATDCWDYDYKHPEEANHG